MYSSRMQLIYMSFLLCALMVVGCETATSNPSAEAVRNFYTWRIDSRLNGMPSAAEIALMAPHLSRELRTLLSEVSADYSRSAAPSQSERTIENGDWFTSMFDGPTSLIVGDIESKGTQHIVSVRFTSAKQLPAVNWRDRVVVIEEEGRHVIANVQYENHWGFKDDATLLQVLKDPKARRKRHS
jgi:hypothetical protein